MAIDESLLLAAVEGACAVRFYEWDAATVSLGHFQSAEDVPPPLRELPVVKRLSGGGAILHHHELTYSCALTAAHPLAREPGLLYEQVHQAIIGVLWRFGIDGELRGAAAFADKPFLCFARGDARDVVIGPHKIIGSAQRRRQGAVLQHGSILLERSPHAPDFPGIRELTGIALTGSLLVPHLSEAFLKLTVSPLANGESNYPSGVSSSS